MSPVDFIREQLDDHSITRSVLLTELCLDSLELLQLQLDCEKQFGKKISDLDFSRFQTVGDLADALR